MSGRVVREGAKLTLVALAYFLVAALCLRLASINPSATPIWPPTGIAIAVTLLWGYRIAPAIFVAAFLVNQLTAGSIFTSLAIAFGNTLEATAAVYLVRLWGASEQIFDTPTGVAKFVIVSLVATTISATIGVGSLVLDGHATPSNFAPVWLTWWLGDLAGALVVTPVVFLWAKTGASLQRKHIAAAGITYLVAVAVGIVAFSPLVPQTAIRDPLGFLAILPLLWAALRRGPRDTATVALLLAAFAVWGTLQQGGPFARANLNDSFLMVLMFMISTSVPSLALSADVAQRRRAEEQERFLVRELSHRVGNTLAVLQSVFRRSARHASTVGQLEEAFEGRLANLAVTHNLLSENTWQSAMIGDLVRAAVRPYCAHDFLDCRFFGEDVRVPASMVLSLTMVLHELATNAAKHGAFKAKGGKLDVAWRENGAEAGTKVLQLEWLESGRVDSRGRTTRGYGTTLIDTTLATIGGQVDRKFTKSGMSLRLTIPLV